MTNHDREEQIAMILAKRAYLYSLFHAVFGGEPALESMERIYNDQTIDMLKTLRAEVSTCEDGALAALRLGEAGPRLDEAADAALACAEMIKRSMGEQLEDELKSDFVRLFVVPGASYVHLWESPYVGKEGMVFQESTLDVRSYYHAAGYKLQAEKHFPDDHIAAMMDYLGRMAQRAYEAYADGNDAAVAEALAVQRRFVESHVLTWVDDFAAKVAQLDGRGCYAALAYGMAAFARFDFERSARLIEEIKASL